MIADLDVIYSPESLFVIYSGRTGGFTNKKYYLFVIYSGRKGGFTV